MVTVWPAARVSPERLIVRPDTDIAAALAVVYPGAVREVDGALQPLGTTTLTVP